MVMLTPMMEKFVLHWGEMGTRWGVNRTVAQIHALLYIADRPLHAEEIAEALSVARSNVSTSLRELQSWQLVRTVHVMGDRRDHFDTHSDVWEMFRLVLEERKRREIDPTRRLLKECLAESAGKSGQDQFARQRIEAMLEFFETTSSWFEQIRKMPGNALIRFLKLGGKVTKMMRT
jgi:DNA-binding transcriptional regulator GbsR (MarR family)